MASGEAVRKNGKQAKRRECLVQDEKHTGKKTLLTGYIFDPTFTISKTLQQRKAIPNSVWTKE